MFVLISGFRKMHLCCTNTRQVTEALELNITAEINRIRVDLHDKSAATRRALLITPGLMMILWDASSDHTDAQQLNRF